MISNMRGQPLPIMERPVIILRYSA